MDVGPGTPSPDDGYGFIYATHTKKSLVMDERGVLTITASGFWTAQKPSFRGIRMPKLTEIVPGIGGDQPGHR